MEKRENIIERKKIKSIQKTLNAISWMIQGFHNTIVKYTFTFIILSQEFNLLTPLFLEKTSYNIIKIGFTALTFKLIWVP